MGLFITCVWFHSTVTFFSFFNVFFLSNYIDYLHINFEFETIKTRSEARKHSIRNDSRSKNVYFEIFIKKSSYLIINWLSHQWAKVSKCYDPVPPLTSPYGMYLATLSTFWGLIGGHLIDFFDLIIVTDMSWVFSPYLKHHRVQNDKTGAVMCGIMYVLQK